MGLHLRTSVDRWVSNDPVPAILSPQRDDSPQERACLSAPKRGRDRQRPPPTPTDRQASSGDSQTGRPAHVPHRRGVTPPTPPWPATASALSTRAAGSGVHAYQFRRPSRSVTRDCWRRNAPQRPRRVPPCWVWTRKPGDSAAQPGKQRSPMRLPTTPSDLLVKDRHRNAAQRPPHSRREQERPSSTAKRTTAESAWLEGCCDRHQVSEKDEDHQPRPPHPCRGFAYAR